MSDWYGGLPPKKGQYLCTVLRAFDLRPKVWQVWFNGKEWNAYRNTEILAWTYPPPPWNMTDPLRKNPYEGLSAELAEYYKVKKAKKKDETKQERFEREAYERIRQNADRIKRERREDE